MRPPPALLADAVAGPLVRGFVARFNRLPFARGARVSDWYRGPEANGAANGAEYSQHLLGLAIDVVTPNPHQLVAAARGAGLTAIYHNAGSGFHVHIQASTRGYIGRLLARAPHLARYLGATSLPVPKRVSFA